MALKWNNMPCGLCGQPIGEEDQYAAMPAFLGPQHPLARFSDSVFHLRCFEASPDRKRVEELFARFQSVLVSSPSTFEAHEAWIRQAMKEFQ